MKRPGFGFNRRYKNGRAPFKPEEYMGLVERTPMRLRNYVRTAQTRKDGRFKQFFSSFPLIVFFF